MRVTVPLAALLVALTGAAMASPAGAQDGSGHRLSAPGGSAVEAPSEAPSEEAPSEEAPPDVSLAEVPPAPGSGPPPDDVRYPIPSPADTAQRASTEPSIRISSRVTTRLRALDANLRALAAAGGSNIVNAVLSLLTGGLSVTLGALREPNDDFLSIYLYVYGGTAAARGVLDLVLTPNASGPSITYQHMPMSSRRQVRERLEYGESALASLAEQSLIARVLDATLNMAAGVAVVPIYLAPNDFAITDPLDYFVLIGAGVSIVSGIITLISTSAAEQRWDAYVQLRERLAEERDDERQNGTDGAEASSASDDELAMPSAPRTDWRVSGGPTRDGAFMGLSLTF